MNMDKLEPIDYITNDDQFKLQQIKNDLTFIIDEIANNNNNNLTSQFVINTVFKTKELLTQIAVKMET